MDNFKAFRKGSQGKTKDEVVSLAISFGVSFIFDLTEVRERAYVVIDTAANKVDAKYTTTGGQMPAIYQGKIKQCEKWLSAGSPDVSTGSYGYIRAEMKRLATLNQPADTLDAVNLLMTTGSAWEDTIGELREEYRGVGKSKVTVALNATEINDAVAEAKSLLGSL
jgi:hypothetical protein